MHGRWLLRDRIALLALSSALCLLPRAAAADDAGAGPAPPRAADSIFEEDAEQTSPPDRSPPRSDDSESTDERVARGEPDPEPAPRPKKQAPPTAAELQQEVERVRHVFGAGLTAAKKPEQKLAVATRMFQAGVEEQRRLSTRYALLSMARDLAAEVGSTAIALDAVDELDRTFAIDTLVVQAETAAQLSRSVSVSSATALVEQIGQMTEQAVAADRYDVARQLGASGVAVAKRAKDRGLLSRAGNLSKEVAVVERGYRDAAKAVQVLAKKPEDANANLVVGRFRCFLKGDWEAGLPLLARGSDISLRRLAKADLAGGPDQPSDAWVRLGDAWWDMGEAQTGLAQRRLRGRAAHWYQVAGPKLAGLTKVRVDKRLAQLRETGPRSAWLVVFRSANPANWNKVVKAGKDSAMLLEGVPDDIDFLRLTHVEGRRSVIIPMTKDRLLQKSLNAPGSRYGWQGLSEFQFNAHNLGVYDAASDASTPGNIHLVDLVGAGYRGWGFGHKFLLNDTQGYGWAGEPLGRSVFEVSVKAGPLTAQEEKFLLEQSSGQTGPARDRTGGNALADRDGSEGPPVTPTTGARPGATLAADGAVDLFALIDLDKDVLAGDWKRFRDGAYLGHWSNSTRIEIPYQLPDEYELTLDVAAGNSHDDKSDFWLILPVRGGTDSAVLGFLVNRRERFSCIGIHNVDGKIYSQPGNRTCKRMPDVILFAKDKRHVLKVLATHKNLRISVDGKQVYDLGAGIGSRIWGKVDPPNRLLNAAHLAVGGYFTDVFVYGLTVKPLGSKPGKVGTRATEDPGLKRLKKAGAHFGGHVYQQFPVNVSLAKARELCAAMGGALLVIDSREENEFISQLIRKSGVPAYIDLERRDGRWVGPDGEVPSYLPLDPERYQDPLEPFAHVAADGQVTSVHPVFPVSVVCEWAGDARRPPPASDRANGRRPPAGERGQDLFDDRD